MKEDKHLIALRTRVEDINKVAETAERVSEIKCGAFFLQAMANFTGAPVKSVLRFRSNSTVGKRKI